MWQAVVTFVDRHNLEIVLMFLFYVLNHETYYIMVPDILN